MQFARVVEVQREKVVEKEVNVPVLVPKKDSISIRNELSLSLLVEKLITEVKRVRKDNPNVKFLLDEDIELIFFSDFVGGRAGGLGEELSKELNSYKESQFSNLLKYGKTWSTDHEMIFNTVLSERFLMANTIKKANLEI